MEFLKKNIALIISIALSYTIFNTTGEYWPNIVHKLLGIDPDWSATKYKLPILILAFLAVFAMKYTFFIRNYKQKLKNHIQKHQFRR